MQKTLCSIQIMERSWVVERFILHGRMKLAILKLHSFVFQPFEVKHKQAVNTTLTY